MRRKILLIKKYSCVVATFTFLSIGCRKDDDNSSNTFMHISSISPASGKYGIMDTIHGGGFGSAANDIELFFNSAQAKIISVSDTEIITSVPKNAESGFLTIRKNNQQVIYRTFVSLYIYCNSKYSGGNRFSRV